MRGNNPGATGRRTSRPMAAAVLLVRLGLVGFVALAMVLLYARRFQTHPLWWWIGSAGNQLLLSSILGTAIAAPAAAVLQDRSFASARAAFIAILVLLGQWYVCLELVQLNRFAPDAAAVSRSPGSPLEMLRFGIQELRELVLDPICVIGVMGAAIAATLLIGMLRSRVAEPPAG